MLPCKCCSVGLLQRYNYVVSGVGEKLSVLEEVSGRLTELDDCSRDLDSTLARLEERLEAHNNLGSSAKDPKYQDKIRVG